MGNNEHTIVYLIGMGPGNSDCLTREAVQALSQATVCIGASRMLAIWKSLCEEDGRDAEQTFYNAYKAEEIAKLMPEVRDFEPYDALDGKEDGLMFYRQIIEQAKQYLKSDGYLMFEIGYDQGEAVSTLMKQAGYEDVRVVKDLAGSDRVVTGKGRNYV